MTRRALPRDFRALLQGVKGKRPRTVVEHILEHGQVTTEELKDRYGYNHPPRAIRDVREQGVPLETFRVKSSDGRSIAAYRFGSLARIRSALLTGRTAFSAELKAALLERSGARCNLYLAHFPERELQIDHRIPFEIGGEGGGLSRDPEDYMLVCGSANRVKSWGCEHCRNWTEKNPATCRSCYWAYPESHTHVAMQEARRLDIMWLAEEVREYDRLQAAAGRAGQEAREYLKAVLREHLPPSGN